MKTNLNSKIFAAMFAAYVAAIAVPGPAHAEIADLANSPLANSGSGPVLPNLMFILDDSGSMEWNHMPDSVLKLTSGGFKNKQNVDNNYMVSQCKDSSLVANAVVLCADDAPSAWGEPPFNSPDFNKVYYNPDVFYSAPVDALGVSKGDAPFTAAPDDGYLNATPKNLGTEYPDIYYCLPGNTASFTASSALTTLTVTAVTSGTIRPGDLLSASSITSNQFIVAQVSGVPIGSTGGPGVYTLSKSQTQTSRTYTSSVANPPSSAHLSNTSVCRRNGVDNLDATNKYFLYWSTSTTNGGLPYTGFTARRVVNGNAHYYTIRAHEYCKDANLWDCALANADGTAPAGYDIPAPIRYCKTATSAGSTSAVADAAGAASHRCQKNWDTIEETLPAPNLYTYARYGRFKRVNLDATSAPFKKNATAVRPDCASAIECTLAEEQKNFANWYTWYRSRMAMMKSAAGHAFQGIADNYRVGFITINPGDPVTNSKFLPIAKFDAGQKGLFYTKLYQQTASGTTPLREALSRVGRYYGGITGGINSGMIGAAPKLDPVEQPCQQNFALLTTDGYWNDNDSDAQNLAGNAVKNQDNVPTATTPTYVSRATGTIDGQATTEKQDSDYDVVEQGLCTGIANVNFGDGGAAATTACGCSGNQTRIWQRTRRTHKVENFDSGKSLGATVNNVGGSEVFTPITGCTTPFIETKVTPYLGTDYIVCSAGNNTSFSPGPQAACGCSSSPSRSRVMTRTRTYNQTQTLTDGVQTGLTPPGSPITYSTPVAASAALGGTCSTTTPTAPSNTSVPSGATVTTNNGGTKLVVTFTPTTTQFGPTVTTTVTAAGFENTLADVAMYYYKTDLRAAMTDNVPTNSKDVAPHQHMTTFTLGLGLKGVMEYQADYETSATGDFAKIKAATLDGCSWIPAGKRCDWPKPALASPTTLDDLWHAAVNGRGVYYSATDPNSLSDGLTGALNNLKVQTASASASATSSPNITETENFIYSSTFRTVAWDGEVVAQRIDTILGTVIPKIEWSAQTLLDQRITKTTVPGDTDNRTIWTFDSGDPLGRKAFRFSNLTASVGGKNEGDWFKSQCPDLGQCATLSVTQQATANDGTNMVNYLRGHSQYEGTVFRDREHVLGDPVNATPAFISRPHFAFNDLVTPDYAQFQKDNKDRQGILYIAANDGMVHALNGDTGQELWAYVPRIVFPRMHFLASDTWVTNHEYLVDGSPQIMDIYDENLKIWRTVMVAGLNKGGRGFYALDITDPVVTGPKPMWEICSDKQLCEITDDDMGYSYGNPVITKRESDGKWVVLVTSGMNNVSPGNGRGFLYVLDALTGKILDKVEAADGATTVGDTTTPSGFSKISAFANDFNSNNTATLVYGGDLYGNVWRFDMSVSPPKVMRLAELKDAGGKPQPITSRPELAFIEGYPAVYIGTGRYLGLNDLVDPATLGLPWAYQQTLYAFSDRGKQYGDIRKSTPGLVKQTITDSSGVRTITKNPVKWDDSTDNGWYVDFNPGGTSKGERVNLDPQLVLGTLVVTTNVPNNTPCTTGGDSFVYQFDYFNGGYVNTAAGGVVAQKFTGQITVGVVIVRLPSGVFKGIATGATGSKTSLGINIGSGGASGRRVSWRELVQ